MTVCKRFQRIHPAKSRALNSPVPLPWAKMRSQCRLLGVYCGRAGYRNGNPGIICYRREGAEMPEDRIRVAPNTVAYADRESHKLVVEFAIPGAPTESVDVKILEDSVHLTAPARDIEYVSALALGWPVKPDKAEATYEHGLLRIEVPFKDPMEDAVKVVIKPGGTDTKTKVIEP